MQRVLDREREDASAGIPPGRPSHFSTWHPAEHGDFRSEWMRLCVMMSRLERPSTQPVNSAAMIVVAIPRVGVWALFEHHLLSQKGRALEFEIYTPGGVSMDLQFSEHLALGNLNHFKGAWPMSFTRRQTLQGVMNLPSNGSGIA
jgi:hypothetical protein